MDQLEERNSPGYALGGLIAGSLAATVPAALVDDSPAFRSPDWDELPVRATPSQAAFDGDVEGSNTLWASLVTPSPEGGEAGSSNPAPATSDPAEAALDSVAALTLLDLADVASGVGGDGASESGAPWSAASAPSPDHSAGGGGAEGLSTPAPADLPDDLAAFSASDAFLPEWNGVVDAAMANPPIVVGPEAVPTKGGKGAVTGKTGASVTPTGGIDLGSQVLAAPGVDPGAPGPLAITKEEYDFGNSAITVPGFPTATTTAPIEFIGSVIHPTDLSGGEHPLVMIMHGRHSTVYNPTTNAAALAWPPSASQLPIPSYEGYDYVSNILASHGYIVVSISVNGINAQDNNAADLGMIARAVVMEKHLDFWNTLTTTGAAPFGDEFVGKVDMQDVVTMGHSRGGEGVAANYVYNESLGSPYGIKGVFALAPVDFNRYVVNNANFAVLLPYTDGDVSDLQGVKFYDDARYKVPGDPTPKYSILVMGANHNFYNTIWTPGLFPAGTSDDWSSSATRRADPYAGTPGVNGRLTDAQERSTLVATLSAFVRSTAGGETEFAEILKGDAPIPPSSLSKEIYFSYQAPDTAATRLDLNRQTGPENLDINTLGGAVTQSGLSTYKIVGYATTPTSLRFVLPDQPRGREPHTTISSRATSLPGLSQLVVTWDDPSAIYENALPAGSNDVSGYDVISFRAGLNFADYRNVYATQDFSVALTDGAGNSKSVPISDFTKWLFYPPGKVSPLPKLVLSMIRIPLGAFVGVNLTDVRSVQFKFDRRPTGALVFADLAFADPATPPATIA